MAMYHYNFGIGGWSGKASGKAIPSFVARCASRYHEINYNVRFIRAKKLPESMTGQFIPICYLFKLADTAVNYPDDLKPLALAELEKYFGRHGMLYSGETTLFDSPDQYQDLSAMAVFLENQTRK